MASVDVHFRRKSRASLSSPANSRPGSRAGSPTSSKPGSRAGSRKSSPKRSTRKDAVLQKLQERSIATNEWRAPGLYSNSKPSSAANSRKNSQSEVSKDHLDSSIIINKESQAYPKHMQSIVENIPESEEIKKALTTIEWKAAGVYSSPNSAANSRKTSLVWNRRSRQNSINQHQPNSSSRKNSTSNNDGKETEKAVNTCEWKASGVYHTPKSGENSRKTSLVWNTRSRQNSINQSQPNSSKDANDTGKALKTCEWRSSGIYSSNPSSAANSRKSSLADKHNKKITRGAHIQNENDENSAQEISKEAIEKALNSCEWRTPGVYSSKPNTPSTSRRNSLDNKRSATTSKNASRKNSISKDGTKSPRKTNKGHLSRQSSKDYIQTLAMARS